MVARLTAELRMLRDSLLLSRGTVEGSLPVEGSSGSCVGGGLVERHPASAAAAAAEEEASWL